MDDEETPEVIHYRVKQLELGLASLIQKIDDVVDRIPIHQFTPAQHHALVNWVNTMAQESIEQRRLKTSIRTTLFLIAGTVIIDPIVVIAATRFFGK